MESCCDLRCTISMLLLYDFASVSADVSHIERWIAEEHFLGLTDPVLDVRNSRANRFKIIEKKHANILPQIIM